jgi:hypothetical protein
MRNLNRGNVFRASRRANAYDAETARANEMSFSFLFIQWKYRAFYVQVTAIALPRRLHIVIGVVDEEAIPPGPCASSISLDCEWVRKDSCTPRHREHNPPVRMCLK